MIPPTKFQKSDLVVDMDNKEGVVTEVFVSYPTTVNLANWANPVIHYKVKHLVHNGTPTSDLYLGGELTDARQTQLEFPSVEDAENHDWNYKNAPGPHNY